MISTASLVETTWLSRYHRPTEITYDEGSEFIGNEFIKSLIQYTYGISDKPSTLGNPMSNALLKRINQVLGNLVRTFNISQTYVDENDLWMGILATAAFAISSTTNTQKWYSLGQLVFGHDAILPIKNKMDWKLIHQQKQGHIIKDNIHKNKHSVDYNYKVGGNFMLTKQTEYKYKTPYMGPFGIT